MTTADGAIHCPQQYIALSIDTQFHNENCCVGNVICGTIMQANRNSRPETETLYLVPDPVAAARVENRVYESKVT